MGIKNLLVIEKSKFKTETIKRVFTNLGYKNIEIVEEEETGINSMQGKFYDLILVGDGLLKDKQRFYKKVFAVNRDLAESILFL